MSQRKRRSFLHWLFFQNTDKKRPPRPVRALLPDHGEERNDIPRQLGFSGNVDTMHEEHQNYAKNAGFAGNSENFNTEHEPDYAGNMNTAHDAQENTPVKADDPAAATYPEKWIKLAIRSEKVQTVIDLTSFPVEIGSVRSSFKLHDKGISPRHAVMDLHSDMLSIVDTYSQNGVYIGDTLIEAGVTYPVFPGDTITVGNTDITVIDYSRDSGDAEPGDYAESTVHDKQADSQASTILDASQPDTQEIAGEAETAEAPVTHEAPVAPEIPANFDVPEPHSKPSADPEPANTTSSIMKLLDEPNASLLNDVLEIAEPPKASEPTPEPEERQLTSEDIDENLPQPESEKESVPSEPEEEPTQESTDINPPSPVLALTAEDFINALVDESSSAELLPELTLAEQLASMDIETPTPPTGSPEPKEPTPTGPPPVCSKCDATNEPNDKFCGKCGTPLTAKAPPPAVKAFCGQCGAKNEHMTKFCGDCGFRLG